MGRQPLAVGQSDQLCAVQHRNQFPGGLQVCGCLAWLAGCAEAETNAHTDGNPDATANCNSDSKSNGDSAAAAYSDPGSESNSNACDQDLGRTRVATGA